MSLASPSNAMAREYVGLDAFTGRDADGHGPTERRLLRAKELLANPDEIVGAFEQSVSELVDFFAAREHQRPNDKFFATARKELTHSAGLSNTAEVGALMRAFAATPFPVLGASELSFYYVERELLLTQLKGVQSPAGAGESVGSRIDLLLANADPDDKTPIVGEVKVTSPRGSPDKDPFSALIQALACATYLLPKSQMKRLCAHDQHDRLSTTGDRLDVYVITVGEPAEAKFWFDLRDCAERLSQAVLPGITGWIRTIAFLELAWLDTPSGAKRGPRVTKRFVSGPTN